MSYRLNLDRSNTIYNRLVILLISFLSLNACAYVGVYKIPEIRGTIIDDKTNLPLNNVVIVAERPIKGGDHSGHTGYLPYQQARNFS